MVVGAGWGRAYFALQAVAGAAWWASVALSPWVRTATLGSLDAVVVAALDLPLFVGASALAAVLPRRAARVAAAVAAAWTTIVALGLAGWATVTGEAGLGVVVMAAAVVGSATALALLVSGRVPTEWVASGPFRAREARGPESARRHLVATLTQMLVFWATFLGLLPLVVVLAERRWGLAVELPPPATPVGVVLFLGATALGVGSAVAMATRGSGTPLPSATARRLVVAGPYRWVRNPMAVAGIAQGVSVGLLWSSWLVVGYALAGAVVWHGVVRPIEEADLEERFGEPYRRYRAAVRCWWPRVVPVPASPR